MAWMIREDQLDPDQRDFINVESKKKGNIWVKGFAGSGKSVLLVHSLKDILNKEPQAKVAIVVYTHSLIDMFKTGMKELNIPATVPVMTYCEFDDKCTSHYDYVFCDEVQDLPDKVLYSMRDKVGKVIVAGDSNQSIYDEDPKWGKSVVNPEQVGDIIKASAFPLNRIHRLTRSIISAVQKLLPSMNIWGAKRDTTKVDVNIRLCEASNEREEVKYVYQEALKGAKEGYTSAILIPTHKKCISFINTILNINNKPECQVERRIAYYVEIESEIENPKDLIDKFNKSGINIVETFTNNKNEQDFLQRYVITKGIIRRDVVKTIAKKKVLFGYYFDETIVENYIQKLNSMGILCEKRREEWPPKYDSINTHLRNNGIRMQYIGNNFGSLEDAGKNHEVIIMTYHSSKGLDFDSVFLPFVNNSLFAEFEHYGQTKTDVLFMVAMTRSKMNLYLTYFGYTHNLVDKFKDGCTKISIPDILNPKTTATNNEPNFDY